MAAMRTSEDATIVGDTSSDTSAQRPNAAELNRRNILLGGTALAAASVLGTGTTMRPAAAQTAASLGKPNILVIFGDDIGQTNISAYSFGLMGYKTPNIDRIAKEGMMFTDYYAENSCTAGRSTFITGQSCQAHRPLQSRHSRRAGRPPGPRHHHRSGAEAARLCHRAIRQEPSGRQGRISADQCTASTSSSAISITSTPRKNPSDPIGRRTDDPDIPQGCINPTRRDCTAIADGRKSRTPDR